MLTINQILKHKPTFILSYDSSQGLLCDDDEKDIIGCDDEYLGDLTIQYQSLTANGCVSFTIEVLVQEYDSQVTIEQMDTCYDRWSVYVNNIKDLPDGSHHIWAYDLDDTLHTKLVSLMESQPIHDIPEHFIIESY